MKMMMGVNKGFTVDGPAVLPSPGGLVPSSEEELIPISSRKASVVT